MQKSNIEEDFKRNIFCDTNNVGIGIYNASAAQDKAMNKNARQNDCVYNTCNSSTYTIFRKTYFLIKRLDHEKQIFIVQPHADANEGKH